MRTLAVDALRMVGQRTAMGRHIEYLVAEWSRVRIPFDRVVLMAPRPVALPPLGTATEILVDSFAGALPLVAWEQVALPRRARAASILFCPSYIAPLAGTMPLVVANHGIYERIPDEFSRLQRLRSTTLHRLSARRASRTIANSLNTRTDVAEYFRLPGSRIDVVYPAASETFFDEHLPDTVAAEVERMLGARAPYLIFVGKLSRRRHLPELIAAFARLRATDGPAHRLLVVGPDPAGLDVRALAREHGVASAVTYVPHLEPESLALLYAGADAFVLPTTYEGISHTMFEAMASRTAVLTVEHPALVEGAGDAVLALPTPSVDELYGGMRRLVTDTRLRDDLAERGRKRAASFSWTAAARDTVEILDRVARPHDLRARRSGDASPAAHAPAGGSTAGRPPGAAVPSRPRRASTSASLSGSGLDARQPFWDANARRYDARFDARGADGYALRARLAVTLALVGDGPGDALDAGMGPGRLCVELARRGFTVSGVDSSAAMVALARQRLPGFAARLQHASIEELPFDDASFDVVVATGVLEFAQAATALGELARVLRPRGLAVVSYPNARSAYGRWKARGWYPLSRSAKALVTRRRELAPAGAGALAEDRVEELLAGAGLEPEGATHSSYLLVPAPIDTLLPRLAELVGRRLEASRRLHRVLATQVVYAARKPRETSVR